MSGNLAGEGGGWAVLAELRGVLTVADHGAGGPWISTNRPQHAAAVKNWDRWWGFGQHAAAVKNWDRWLGLGQHAAVAIFSPFVLLCEE